MRDDTATRLMESIAANKLVVFCGAGLSMAPPSSVPGAAGVARECADRYQRLVGTPLDAAVIGDVEKMSKWFGDNHQFEKLFIERLVPWERFNVAPNDGHRAVADFLACGVVHSGLTTNYDRLVELAAESIGEPDFLPITNSSDLAREDLHRPYLKVHGCMTLGNTRRSTIWYKEQFDQDDIKLRMEAFRSWLQTHLVGRDILFVGFWTDWAFLSDILASTIDAIGPSSVYLVDPNSPDALEAKAPLLWEWCHQPDIAFYHEQESGADFLDSLRQHFSRVFLRHVFQDAADTYNGMFEEASSGSASQLDGHSINQLYALRRDLCGVPRNRPVRAREPRPENRVHAAVHARLLDQGASYDQHTYSYGGDVFRIVSGSGQLMSEVKKRYADEPPLPIPLSRVICVGAIPDPTPASIVRPAATPSIVRAGVAESWVGPDDLINSLRTTHA